MPEQTSFLASTGDSTLLISDVDYEKLIRKDWTFTAADRWPRQPEPPLLRRIFTRRFWSSAFPTP